MAKAKKVARKKRTRKEHIPPAEMVTDGFTDKQRMFVNAYTEYGSHSFLNGAESARRAGHSKKTARQIATENLSKPYIRSEIDRRLKEFALGPAEVLARLSMHARGDISPFTKQTKGGDVVVNLTTPDARAALPLIKSIQFIKKTGGSGDKQWSLTQTKIDIHDAHAANVMLGKYHKMFVDRTRNDDYEDEIADLVRGNIATLEDVRSNFGDEIATRVAVKLGILPSQDRSVQTQGASSTDQSGDSQPA